jgi:segregation and condensation protein B
METTTAPNFNLKNILESLLFVARQPLDPEQLEAEIKCPKELIASLLEELKIEYDGKGINIVKVAGGYLMGTNPVNANYVAEHLRTVVQTTLTPQALETLAIIAYKQPVTRSEIERVRGVNSDGPVETLLQKKLIEELGRSEAIGRPILYGTSEEFLRHFGLQDLTSLPPLPVAVADQDQLFKTALHESSAAL